MLDTQETIVAIGTAAGPGSRGMVRLSGPQVLQVLRLLFVPDRPWPDVWERSTVFEGRLRFPTLANGQAVIDASSDPSLPALAMVWPDERSYTGQPAAEIHMIGCTPLLEAVVESACSAGARMATPGEFTLRAFLSGRLDLTQAEAVLAVIDAESESQFDVALSQLSGGLAGPLGELRRELISLLAELEAGLDFVEEDIEFISSEQLLKSLRAIQLRLEETIQQIAQRDLAAEMPVVALVGKPNSGKSSLFNVLTQTEMAIVTHVAGTTTDFVSGVVEVRGRKLMLVDTAGEETANSEISAEAQIHRVQQSRQANVRILCVDGRQLAEHSQESTLPSSNHQTDSQQSLLDLVADLGPNDLIVATKLDLVEGSGPALAEVPRLADCDWLEGRKLIWISNHTKSGVQALTRALIESIEQEQQVANREGPAVVGSTVQRASDSLRLASTAIAAAMEGTEMGWGEEIVAAEIREALNALGLVVGQVYTDDILDLVFGRFCIGK